MEHDGAGIQPCPFCGQSYRHYDYLVEHIEKRHTDGSEFVFRDGPEHRASPERTPSPPLLPPPSRRPPSVLRKPLTGYSSMEMNITPPLPNRAPPPAPIAVTPTIRTVPEDDISEESDNSSDDAAEDEFVSCPLEECGEEVPASEIDEHIELHQAEQVVLDDPSSAPQQQLQHQNQHHYHSRHYSSSTSSRSHKSKVYASSQSTITSPKDPDLNSHALNSYYAPQACINQHSPTSAKSRKMDHFKVGSSASSATSSNPVSPNRRRSSPAAMFSSSSTAGTLVNSETSSFLLHPANISSDRPIGVSSDEENASISDQASQFDAETKPQLSTNLPEPLRNVNENPRKLRRKRHHSGFSWNGIKRKYSFINGLFGDPGKRKSSRDLNPIRLGRKELGPHAYEKHMPKWLYQQLERGPKVHRYNHISRDGRVVKHEVVENETPGIVPMLARLSELDPDVGYAFYCHPATTHVCKESNEGGFCGYRNIQMQVSYLQGAKAVGHEMFPGNQVPGILHLQDVIENAWDNGISPISRQQIGTLKGTRKWIGTLEAMALYANLNIDCEVYAFADSKEQYAHENLCDKVEAYFQSGVSQTTNYAGHPAPGERINRTLLPPLYLQQPGHSLTIIGIERHVSGERFLMVLDPMYRTSRGMNQLLDVGPRGLRRAKTEAMKIYRRGDHRLSRYEEFEILILSAPPPAFPAWEVGKRTPR
ncbi:DUF1671-domain-containing protein [Microthyrium microscopicum]|uniref:DUF1671-domain-containing protein n=1 Tax=Microthyrium microscopicum TaxID=703497 RepID=A0A6A6UDK0_9PEZI|nr:DUF1671-domain-containing protein [Microthyrium microscopicum]